MTRGRDSVILESAKFVDAATQLKSYMTSRAPNRLTAADPVERRGNVGLYVTPIGVPLANTQEARVGHDTYMLCPKGELCKCRREPGVAFL